MRRGSIASELIMCGGDVCSILLLALVARCIDVCIWRIFIFMSVVVTVWGSVGMFVVYRLTYNLFNVMVKFLVRWLNRKSGTGP